MKKILAVTLAMMVVLCAGVWAADISFVADGEPVEFDVVKPVSEDGVYYVPLRFVFEKLGATVMYDDATATVTAYFAGNIVLVQIGNEKGFVNEGTYAFAKAPYVVEGRTLVELDFIEEVFGGKAEVSEDGLEIVYISPEAPAEDEEAVTQEKEAAAEDQEKQEEQEQDLETAPAADEDVFDEDAGEENIVE